LNKEINVLTTLNLIFNSAAAVACTTICTIITKLYAPYKREILTKTNRRPHDLCCEPVKIPKQKLTKLFTAYR